MLMALERRYVVITADAEALANAAAERLMARVRSASARIAISHAAQHQHRSSRCDVTQSFTAS
jgi:hypothetical protein